MSDDLDPTTDPILSRLRRDRPVAGPAADVRARHRDELDGAMDAAGRRRRPTWLVAAAAAACVAVIGGVVLANDGGSDADRQVATGDEDAAESSSASGDGAPPLTSEECGGALPFDVPVPAGFEGPVPGPATGEPAASSPDQLVAHWSNGSTEVEVRWPADASDPDALGLNEAEWTDWQYSLAITGADLNLSAKQRSDRLGEPVSDPGFSVTYRETEPSASRFEMAVTKVAFDTPTDPDQSQFPAEVVWGESMCGVVQLTFASTDGANVLPVAESSYQELTRPGGLLFPEATPPNRTDLVTARADATELEPVTQCDVPEGVDQDPTESTPVDVISTHNTPDEALAAHIETRTTVDEGPFGTSETTYTVPTSGYTAISLPDGRVAYQFLRFRGLTAYFIAEEVDGGWAITRYEGPTC